MARTVLRIVLVVFGGMIASRLVEMYLTSERGRRSVASMGLADLTTHQGVELAQRYARAVASALGGAVVAIQESATASFDNPRKAGWPENVMAVAQFFLAFAALAKIVSDFIEERRRLIDEGNVA
jgi:hypothetical protein